MHDVFFVLILLLYKKLIIELPKIRGKCVYTTVSHKKILYYIKCIIYNIENKIILFFSKAFFLLFFLSGIFGCYLNVHNDSFKVPSLSEFLFTKQE